MQENADWKECTLPGGYIETQIFFNYSHDIGIIYYMECNEYIFICQRR